MSWVERFVSRFFQREALRAPPPCSCSEGGPFREAVFTRSLSGVTIAELELALLAKQHLGKLFPKPVSPFPSPPCGDRLGFTGFHTCSTWADAMLSAPREMPGRRGQHPPCTSLSRNSTPRANGVFRLITFWGTVNSDEPALGRGSRVAGQKPASRGDGEAQERHPPGKTGALDGPRQRSLLSLVVAFLLGSGARWSRR